MREIDIKKLSDESLLGHEIDQHQRFKELYNRYWSRLYTYAYNIIEDQEASEDIIQEVFVDLWKRRRWIKVDKVSHYLLKAVKFQVLNHLRNHRIRQSHIDRMTLVRLINTTEDALNLKDLEDTIASALSTLPHRCQQVFRMSRFENLSNKEISEKLNIRVQTVKNQISRAINHLRANLNLESFSAILLSFFSNFL